MRQRVLFLTSIYFPLTFFPEKTLCDLSVFENQKTYLMSFWDVVTVVVVFVTFFVFKGAALELGS